MKVIFQTPSTPNFVRLIDEGVVSVKDLDAEDVTELSLLWRDEMMRKALG